jgi:serine/threonine protein kinase/outer membrane biosynthesis protein TonB
MGARLGRYVLLKHLASGGMADVLLARSDGIEGFERHVVVKRIRPELARDARFTRMFLDEARVAATLHHQHVVQVHDIGEAGGEYFIAMEYVHGEDVRRILSTASRQRNHVPLGHAVAIVAGAAAGLHYAHERIGSDMQPLQIVHRDVSPSNILVGYDGAIKVVDFGIATASMQRETRSGGLKGKISYMSPEQCKGEAVDRRTDVYALGVVLYELATTTRMIKGDSDYRVMEQIVNGRIAAPHARRPDLPKELSAIILRALSTDREKRYATADELRMALDRFAANAGLVVSSSTIATYMQQQFGQRPEPWLALTGDELEGLPVPLDGSAPSNSWSELHASDVARRSTGSIPRFSEPTRPSGPHRAAAQTGPVPTPPIAAIATVTPTSAKTGPIGLIERELPPTPEPRTRPGQTNSPTDARMGWESQAPAPGAPGARSRRKPLLIGGGALLAGAAVWLFGLRGGDPPPPAPVAAVTAPAPVATPDAATAPPAMPAITLADPAPVAHPRPARLADAAPTPRPAPRISDAAPSPRPAPERPAPARPRVQDPPRPARIAMAVPAPAVEPARPAPAEDHHAAPPAPTPPPAPVVAPVPEPAAPAAPQVIAPSALDANRIAGSKNIPPDATTQDAIARAGKTQVQASYKVCVNADGALTTISLLKSTGFPDYDAKIQNAMRSEWRYRPFVINGKPTPVCTALRFLYAQK